jgi:hypothetical protein
MSFMLFLPRLVDTQMSRSRNVQPDLKKAPAERRLGIEEIALEIHFILEHKTDKAREVP